MTPNDELPVDERIRAPDPHEHLLIEPVEFTRADPEARGPRVRLRPFVVLVAVLFAALLGVAWFMFTARAVSLAISPAPDRENLEGGLFVYRLGDRYLVRPGTYRVTAAKAGYLPLDATIEVTDQQDQTIPLELAKLPGILAVATVPAIPARLLVDQQVVGTTPVRVTDLAPGLHDIALRSERYLPYDSEIEIEGMGIEQSLVAELAPAWGDVRVETRPPGATLFVDGTEAGHTPLTAEVPQGKRELKVRLAGFKSWQSDIEISPGQQYTLPRIDLVASDGALSLRSNPAGASVTVAGTYRGQTPISLSLPPGKGYVVNFTRPGFEAVTRTLDVHPEEDIDLNVTLQPVLGTIQLLVTPPGSELFVDGKSMGDPNQRLKLSSARHRLVVRKEGYAPYDAIVTPRPGFDQQVQVALKTVEEARAEAIPKMIVTAAGQEMQLVYPARLALGAPRREPGRRANEVARVVDLTRPFYVSRTEVTNAQFNEFSSSHESGSVGRALLNDKPRPVVNVTWEEAVAYANWLSERDGLPPVYRQEGETWFAAQPLGTGYRLPTEAEWAWIARYADGATPTRFPWGDAMPPVAVEANYADVTARDLVSYYISSYDDGYLGTAPVASFPPNALGLYDLAGNAAEWIHDVYVTNPAPGGEIERDPAGPQKGEYHVIRGSSFMHGRFSELRWTYRDYGAKARPDVGFRLARYLDPRVAEGSETP